MRLIIIFHYLVLVNCSKMLKLFSLTDEEDIKDNPGEQLFLTPLLESNRLEKARNLSEVHFDGFHGVKSFSGYFTVDKTLNSNLFFWFFISKHNYKNASVILWLQGGPGDTDFMGIFMENGPFYLVNNLNVSLRNFSWTETHNVLYIDSPIGTGYSFSNNETNYCTHLEQVASHLYEALRQFFLLFPELKMNPFFVAGESFGGKYVPAIAYKIHKENFNKLKINLKGLLIGNGFSDPINQLQYSDYLFQLGLIDFNEKKSIQDWERQINTYIKNNDSHNGFQSIQDFYDDLKNITGLNYLYNYLQSSPPYKQHKIMRKFVQNSKVRKALHVGNRTFNNGNKVYSSLSTEIIRSVTPWISELLKHYRMLSYNGQLDVVIGYPSTVNFLQKLNFSGAEQYKTAKRYKWYVEDDLAGFVKKAGNLTEVLVRDAGHMVPADQPKWASDLISRFIKNDL